MAIITTPPQTFASMLQLLRARCGLHKTIGEASALEDILTEAHEFVYSQLDDGFPMTSTVSLLPNVATYPWAADIDAVPIARGSVQAVWIAQGSQERLPLLQGINHAMRALSDTRSVPTHYDDRYAGDPAVFTLEVWPTPDAAYTLYVDHERVLTKFDSSADVPSAPYRLVLGYAIAMGKAHYKKPDADAAGQAFRTNLYKQKVKNKENRRFFSSVSQSAKVPRMVMGAGGSAVQVWD